MGMGVRMVLIIVRGRIVGDLCDSGLLTDCMTAPFGVMCDAGYRGASVSK